MYGSAANTPARLAKDANATRSLTNTGTSNNPAWAQVALATGVSGTLPVANGGTAATSAGIAAFNSITGYSAAGATGTTSTNVVFSTSPTLITPALGEPSALVATNASGTAASLTAGNVTTNANLTGPVTSVGNATAIADKALAIAKLADGTDGELITWDASGVIATVAVGTAAQVLTSNGAGAAPTFQAASSGAITREGGNTTEATTTSTSAVDLISATGLTIAAVEAFQFILGARKTTGAAAAVALGLKINATLTADALTGGNKALYASGAGNLADEGTIEASFAGRVTNYLRSGTGTFRVTSSTGVPQGNDPFFPSMTASIPNAEITDVVIRGVSGSASVTLGVDELQVYSMAAS